MIATLRATTRLSRRKVFKSFIAQLKQTISGVSTRPLLVLDLGGTVEFWEDWWGLTDSDGLQITLINNHDVDTTQRTRVSRSAFIRNVNQDATMLSAAEFGNYDLIFSNSFIEHLRTPGAQRKLAQAIVASGVPYFIQTPNKLSLVDPHRPFAPWFALYPKGLREALLVLSSFGNGSRCRSLSEARESQDHYNPLGVRDVRALFPDAWLIVERPFGIPMSILALSRLGKRCSVGTLLAESGPNTRK